MANSDDLQTEDYLSRFVSDERMARMNSVLSKRTDSLTVVLDKVHNYHNISAVVRSAEAFGLAKIHLVGTEFEYSRDISLGTEQWLELSRHSSAESLAAQLENNGFELVVLEPENKNQETSVPVFELPFERQLALVFGNEREGVSDVLREKAKHRAHIPMFGFVDSLNISVACAITLFCSSISGAQAKRRVSTLGLEKQKNLRSEWLRNKVRGAEAILRQVEVRYSQK